MGCYWQQDKYLEFMDQIFFFLPLKETRTIKQDGMEIARQLSIQLCILQNGSWQCSSQESFSVHLSDLQQHQTQRD